MPETPTRKKEPENTKRGQVRELREEREGGSWGPFVGTPQGRVVSQLSSCVASPPTGQRLQETNYLA